MYPITVIWRSLQDRFFRPVGDLLHPPAPVVVVVVVGRRGRGGGGGAAGGWACVRARDASLHSTSIPPSTFLPSSQYLCAQ